MDSVISASPKSFENHLKNQITLDTPLTREVIVEILKTRSYDDPLFQKVMGYLFDHHDTTPLQEMYSEIDWGNDHVIERNIIEFVHECLRDDRL